MTGPQHPTAAETLLAEAFALIERGRIDDAAAKAKAALAGGGPADAAHHVLGLCALAQNRIDPACASFREAQRLAPRAAEHAVMLGVALGQAERHPEAEAALRHALSLLPPEHAARSEIGVNLAVALFQQGKRAEALTLLAPCREPDYGAVANRMLRRIADDADEAGDIATAIVALTPLAERPGATPDVSNRLALLLLRAGRWADAEARLRNALVLDPTFVPALINLGGILKEIGHISESESVLRRAVAAAPESANAHANLGSTLMEAGRIDEAIAATEKTLALDPSLADIESNLCFMLNYTDRPDAEVLAAHRAWDAHHGSRGAPVAPRGPHPAKRPLRVGLVGWDFCEHGGCFIEPLLSNLDRGRIEAVCYSDTARPDASTERMRAAAVLWRDNAQAPDAAVAERIRADGIDVLVDLAGHSAGNRLTLFATKPAPVAATWLGYPNTTGLAAIDGRITDAWADPTGADPAGAEARHTERLLRLPSGFLCYRPPVETPAPAAPPSERLGVVSFGNFNVLPKLSAAAIALWARLLKEVPRSRLVLKCNQMKDDGVRARVLAAFAAQGIEAERLHLLGFVPGAMGHLAAYGEVDIALDPFPYNGTTITCEALWMGVPVVTRAGRRHVDRVGVSLLARAGLPELVAESDDAFITAAAALSEDEGRRRALRAGMRDRLTASQLFDQRAFADSFSAALEALYAGA